MEDSKNEDQKSRLSSLRFLTLLGSDRSDDCKRAKASICLAALGISSPIVHRAHEQGIRRF